MDRWNWMQFDTHMSMRREQALREVQREREAQAARRHEERPAAAQMNRRTFWGSLFTRAAHQAK
jgi:hypothetical protein